MVFEYRTWDGMAHPTVDYGVNGVRFRGPRCDRSQPHIAFLGGSDTFGRFVERPFCQTVALAAGVGAMNLGMISAGVDCILKTPKLIRLANKADHIVVQVPCAALQSNPYYRVHPRRNDRVIDFGQDIQTRFGRKDRFDVHFIRHLLMTLHDENPDRYVQLCQSLQMLWLDKMHLLLDRLQQPVHLVWLAPHTPNQTRFFPLWDDPLFVTDWMIDRLRDRVTSYHQVTPHRLTSVPKTGGMNVHRLHVRNVGQVTHDQVAVSLGDVTQIRKKARQM